MNKKEINSKKTVKIAAGTALLLLFTACKAPMATVIEDQAKNTLPEKYSETNPTESSSGITPWRTFFTDPKLTALIETGLQNNQELMITLQKIEIAKSDVLYRSGRLAPSFSLEGDAGLTKEGRYTSSGAGNATTPIKPGKEMPDPLPNFGAGLGAEWEADIWHKLRTEKESAVAHYLATVEGKNFVLSSLISEIAGNYYELLASKPSSSSRILCP